MKIVISFVKQFLFWLIIFAFSRSVFFVYYHNFLTIEGIDFSEIALSFWHALPLDISTASYILIIPFLISIIQQYYSPNWLNKILLIYVIIIVSLVAIITTAELGIYEEWKTKLHYKALNYITHPDEIYKSSDTATFFILLSILSMKIFVGIWLFKKLVYCKYTKTSSGIFAKAITIIIFPILLFLGIRGGVSEIPITQSKVYFSKFNFINLATVNTTYSFLVSTIENYKFKDSNPFGYYKQDEAKKRIQDIHKVISDTTISILKINRPNIVVLILESWSADLIESLGGKPGITPEFKKLEKEGILFTNLYASGNRSEQAMTSIFAGFPATPITAISHNLDKVNGLPSLTNELKKEGYTTSYYFGGELMYGGINSFITVNGFEVIKEISDFDKNIPRGKLGIHDEYILDIQINDLNNTDQPFFSSVFTVSTHSPYDQPMDDIISWASSKNQNGYLNSAYYTDRCIGDYFKKAKKQSWYNNTLFIIVADHSHDTYNHWPVYKKEYRKIPMLLYGEVLKDEFKGVQIDRISSQVDIAGTLLNQLELSSHNFFWSRNLFNPTTPEFAFYESNDGVGWVSPKGYFVYSNTLNDFMELEIKPDVQDSIVKDGKSYLQVLFQEFMDY